MTQELITLSPIDGSVAVRPFATSDEIHAALTRAKPVEAQLNLRKNKVAV